LEANGFEVKVVDLAKKGSIITGFDPSLIGITCVTAKYPLMPALMKECRGAYSGIPVIVGGPHFSIAAQDAMLLGADSVGVGDCEEAIVEAATDAINGQTLRPEYSSPGKIVDVNKYPIPARHLIPIHEYGYKLYEIPATSLITSRGCPYACGFCAHWENYHVMRYRNVENVIEEVRLLKQIGFHSLNFYEDEFNMYHDRMIKLCKALEPENVLFRAMVRSNLFNEEQAEALAKAGCRQLSVGVESGNAEILKGVQKQTTPEQNTRCRKICRDFGIAFKAFIIVGLPGETRETVADTKRWLIENQVDDLTVSVYMPYLGTPIVSHPERYAIQFKLDYRDHFMSYRSNEQIQKDDLIRTPALSATEIAELRDEVDADVRRELAIDPPLRERESTGWRHTPMQDNSKGPTFSIVHASARPNGWRKVYEDWMSKANHPEDIEYVLSVDLDGPFNGSGSAELELARIKVVRNNRRRCCVDAYNAGAEASTGRVLVMSQDDLFAFPGWDDELRKVIPDLSGEHVVEVSTGGPSDTARYLTVQILTRARYKRFGYIMHPAYISMMSDVEFTEVARRDGVVIDARHLIFEHRHPTNGKAEWDEVYTHENRPENYQLGHQVLANRRARGFPQDTA
jgi:radical SAM superfamily enzyme YgiQ (UPF0313 family)